MSSLSSTPPSRQFGARASERGVVPPPLPQHVKAVEKPLTLRVTSTKRALLKRMGLRMSELTGLAGRRSACTPRCWRRCRRSTSGRLARADQRRREAGTVLALYATYANTASRQLGLLRQVVEAMAAEDSRYDATVQALIAEGRKTRACREAA